MSLTIVLNHKITFIYCKDFEIGPCNNHALSDKQKKVWTNFILKLIKSKERINKWNKTFYFGGNINDVNLYEHFPIYHIDQCTKM